MLTLTPDNKQWKLSFKQVLMAVAECGVGVRLMCSEYRRVRCARER